ncbi:hypothetical protein SCP_0412150 [Sparassis crispa]|uniref:Uncharacterized protein n=1 Tax=Sparassis crispa TaxID=139825 RepID=A0A401GKY0_9APHY|nr:hypothetical protein SCP_0412150 [Sparassis crispa]GBE82828.1 hypothetical protein SCP_0412150 [Sparassis crispa]
MVSFVQSLPTSHNSVSPSSAPRSSSIEPGTLLGRHYSYQMRSPAMGADIAQDAEPLSPSPPLPHHHSSQKRHSSPFPKYLAERTASHLRARDVTEDNYVSYVGAKPAEGAYGEPYPSPPAQPTPSAESETNSSVTVASRSTASTEAKAKHPKTTSKKKAAAA